MIKKKNNTNSEIESKRKEIEKLKKELEAKKEVFEMLKTGRENEDKVRNKIVNDLALFSFFSSITVVINNKFERLLLGVIENYDFLYYDFQEYFINEVNKRIFQEEKDIEEKQIRLENLEYIELQKNAIIKNNKYQKSLNLFTKILAYGVLGQLAYYLNLYLIGLFPKYEAFENVCSVIIILLIIFLVITDLFFYNYNEKIK